jgi:hypothetical protein
MADSSVTRQEPLPNANKARLKTTGTFVARQMNVIAIVVVKNTLMMAVQNVLPEAPLPNVSIIKDLKVHAPTHH